MVFRSVQTAPSVFAMIHAAKPRAPTVIDPSLPAPFRKQTLVSAQICASNILIAGAKKNESLPYRFIHLAEDWHYCSIMSRLQPPSPNLPFSPYLLSAKAQEGERGSRQISYFSSGRKQWLSISIPHRGAAQVLPFYPVIHMQGCARQHVTARCLKALICVPWARRNRRIHIPSIYCYCLILYCKCLIKMMQHKCVLLPPGVHRERHLHC